MATPITEVDNVNHTYKQGNVSYALDPKTNLYQEASKITPAVVTSKAATNEINDIRMQHADMVSGIANQATTNANTKAVADTQAKAKADADMVNQQAQQKLAIDQQTANAKTAAVSGATSLPSVPIIGQSVYNPLTGKTTTIDNIGQNADGSYSITFADTPNTQRIEKGQIGNLTSSTGKIDGTQNGLDQVRADYQAKAKQVEDTISGITSGTIPLNEGQIAQVEGLKQQFQQLIQQQGLINKNATGVANIRGYQTGSAEYDPNFAVKTIGSIVTAGINKVADLNVKMASAVATLTEGFKTNNIKNIKEAYEIYSDASKARTDALQKTIDDSQKVIKEAQEAKVAAEKVQYERVTKPINDILEDAVKNGATKDIIDAIRNAEDAGAAMEAAGQYLQTGTGMVGEYQFYKREEEAAGRTPMDFNKYQTLDANRKAVIAKASQPSVSEVKSNAYSTINQLLGMKNAQGIPYLDTVNGYFTPQGFAELVTAAAEDNISRADFLKQYGAYIAPTEVKSYKLTPAEIKSIGLK